MALPAQYDLTPVVQNDTWDGITVSMSSDGNAFAAALSLVRMTFKTSEGASALALTSADAAEIEITDANAWAFIVHPRVLSLAAGTYSWGIETTDADDVVKTRLAGTLKIIADPV